MKMSQKRRTWKVSENNEVITKRKSTETEKNMANAENGKHKVLGGRRRIGDGKINGDGKNGRVRNERSQKITRSEMFKMKRTRKRKRKNGAESTIGCTGDYPH